MIVARELQASSVRTGILIAGNVNGEIQTVLDTPGFCLAELFLVRQQDWSFLS